MDLDKAQNLYNKILLIILADNFLRLQLDLISFQPVTRVCHTSMSVSTNSSSDIVVLNVGGNYFTTTKSTLRKGDHMLSAMFSGRMPVIETNDGSVFIDRDGKHFRAILNFLRDGSVPLPEEKTQLAELQKEAQYYSIKALDNACGDLLGFMIGCPLVFRSVF